MTSLMRRACTKSEIPPTWVGGIFYLVIESNWLIFWL